MTINDQYSLVRRHKGGGWNLALIFAISAVLGSCANEQVELVNEYKLIDNDGGNYGIISPDGSVYVHGVTAYIISGNLIFAELRIFDLPPSEKRCEYKVIDTLKNAVLSYTVGSAASNTVRNRIDASARPLTSRSCLSRESRAKFVG